MTFEYILFFQSIMAYKKITLKNINSENYQILLSEIEELPFNGIEEEEAECNIYFEENEWKEEYRDILKKYCSDIMEEKIEEQNWNSAWESEFEPVIIDTFCYIKAPFHPERNDIEHIIHLSPKMSFGTGHHETTRQMIQMMRKIDFTEKTVFDFGTGTGILAVLAEKLGANRTLGNDIDEWSIENARETATQNHALKTEITSKDITTIDEHFDIILANINRNILLQHMSDMTRLLNAHGYIFISGIFHADKDIILQSANEFGLKLIAESEENNWACLLLQS